MLLGGEDVEIEALLSVDFDDLPDVGRSRQGNDGFAPKILDRVEMGGLLGHEAVRCNKMRDGEGNLLLPLKVISSRAAFEIDRAVGDQRNAGGRSHRIELHLQLGKLELTLDRVHDAIA